jgi:nitrogen-specific signal transduction histidine kinase
MKMAKVKLIGDVNFEFDVKFNQAEDIVIETKKINVDGKDIVFGKGDIEKINPKAFDFIASRIESILKKNGVHIVDLYAYERDKDYKLIEKLFEIDPVVNAVLNACRNKNKAIETMLKEKIFLLTRDGMQTYLKRYYENNSSARRMI